MLYLPGPVVIVSKNEVSDELYDDNAEDSCELSGCVLMCEYMLQCSGMVMSFGQVTNVMHPVRYLYLNKV